MRPASSVSMNKFTLVAIANNNSHNVMSRTWPRAFTSVADVAAFSISCRTAMTQPTDDVRKEEQNPSNCVLVGGQHGEVGHRDPRDQIN